jgi:hypothetical protein
MKYIFVLLTAIFLGKSVQAQRFNAEVMAGDRNYYYAHSFSQSFLVYKRFGFSHASSLHSLYEEKQKNELMSQTYLSYGLSKHFRIAAGTFYASKPEISASLALQSSFQVQYLRVLIVPRLDLKQGGSYELMTLLDYDIPVSEKFILHIRAQVMGNYTQGIHNRSYQNARIGLKKKHIVFGLALNIDKRGAEKQGDYNWGIFLRHDFSL